MQGVDHRRKIEYIWEYLHNTIVRVALIYGMETTALTKDPGQKAEGGRYEDVVLYNWNKDREYNSK